MNSGKTSTTAVVIILVIIAIVAIVWFVRMPSSTPAPLGEANGTSTPVAVSETTKVSSSFSEYQNAELGFSVKYPSVWEREEGNAGVTMVIPIDKTQVSTVATLQTSIQVLSGKCAFPPVTTVKDRGTVKVGSNTFDMISISNTVQGRNYWDRMYSLQSGDVCYIFHFASITLAPSSKGLTGSNATQATNNNKAIVNSADADFTNMVKSFAFITTPAGVDETKAPSAK